MHGQYRECTAGHGHATVSIAADVTVTTSASVIVSASATVSDCNRKCVPTHPAPDGDPHPG